MSGHNISILDRKRSRLVQAKLFDLVNKTGCRYASVTLPKCGTVPLELDEEILTKALRKLFESRVYEAIKDHAVAENEIITTYSECVKIKSGTLSAMGEGFMNSLITNLAEHAYAKR